MNKENLTPASAAVAAAILEIMDYSGGLGANIHEIVKETKMDAKSVRGNLSDLVKRGIISIDLKQHSGAAFDMWYSNEYEY